VRVKTDSTGSDELTGVVTFTSPTPTKETSNNSSSGNSGNSQNTKSRATYKVEVTLDEPNDRLRMGMTATIDFIVEEAKNAIAVPSGCLISDGAGNYFVNVVTSSGEETSGEESETEISEVMVTTGVSDGYYTEITSGNIQEGDQIQDNSAADSGDYSDMLDGIY
jgi:multidrug efflux pump subunit AcrA (membrane-fusion protein)